MREVESEERVSKLVAQIYGDTPLISSKNFLNCWVSRLGPVFCGLTPLLIIELPFYTMNTPFISIDIYCCQKLINSVSVIRKGDQEVKMQKLIMNTQTEIHVSLLRMDATVMIKHQRQRLALVVALMRTHLACRLPQLPLVLLYPDQHLLGFTAFHHHLVLLFSFPL